MTIDEAIAKYKEITNTDAICPAHCNISCDNCVKESRQLTDWLEELKSYRAHIFSGEITQRMLKEEYYKAIDDFAEKAIKIVYEANNRERNPQPRDMVADIHYKFIDLSKQLKAGGENEQRI